MTYSTIYYNISDVSSRIEYRPGLIFKGTTTINVVLTGLSEEVQDIMFIDIDWGDGTLESYQKDIVYDYKEQSIFDEILYGKTSGSVATIYEHVFLHTKDTYNVALTSQFAITYKNGTFINIVQPISIFQNSYYDELENINIVNAQLLPIEDNNTVVNIEGQKNKQTYISILSAN